MRFPLPSSAYSSEWGFVNPSEWWLHDPVPVVAVAHHGRLKTRWNLGRRLNCANDACYFSTEQKGRILVRYSNICDFVKLAPLKANIVSVMRKHAIYLTALYSNYAIDVVCSSMSG